MASPREPANAMASPPGEALRAPTSPLQGECPARALQVAALAARFARQRGAR